MYGVVHCGTTHCLLPQFKLCFNILWVVERQSQVFLVVVAFKQVLLTFLEYFLS